MYEHLSNAIKTKGLSLRAVAAAIGMPEPTFRAKINGRSECGFTIEEAFAIQDNVFPEMDIKYLFKRNNQITVA
ncbi:MAG: DNA-binding protein [Eubacterium sp.]|nr:DNA-binding protein [Eubacterium sp.]